MKDGIIFVAGIYGVGKSTLCERLSISIGIPCYSAGDLISAINGEIYGRKTANDQIDNQLLCELYCKRAESTLVDARLHMLLPLAHLKGMRLQNL